MTALLLVIACSSPSDDVDIGVDTDREVGEYDLERPDDDDPSDNPVDDPPDDDPPDDDPVDDPPVDETCYLGDARSYDACVLLISGGGLGSGYSYPPAMSGSAQYRPPIAFIDLQTTSESLKLAPNFTLAEIAQAYKGRYAVVQPHAIDRLQDLRDDLGPLVVNSGYRNVDYNAGVGGATYSRHMYGDAFDLDPVSVSLAALESACYAHGAGYVGVYTTHMHCDWRNDAVDTGFFGSARAAWTDLLPELEADLVAVDGVWTAPAIGWDEGEPLREWSAFDADGTQIAYEISEDFVAPPEAVEVEVVVGMALVVTTTL